MVYSSWGYVNFHQTLKHFYVRFLLVRDWLQIYWSVHVCVCSCVHMFMLRHPLRSKLTKRDWWRVFTTLVTGVSSKFTNLYLFLCTHILAISFLLLIIFLSFPAFRIGTFSVTHKLHALLAAWYLWVFTGLTGLF